MRLDVKNDLNHACLHGENPEKKKVNAMHTFSNLAHKPQKCFPSILFRVFGVKIPERQTPLLVQRESAR
jgi:hypothetical protein